MRIVTYEADECGPRREVEMPDPPKYHPLEAKGRAVMNEMLSLIIQGDIEAARGFIRLGVAFADAARSGEVFFPKALDTIREAAKNEVWFPSVVTKGDSREAKAATGEFYDALPLGESVRGLVANNTDELDQAIVSLGLEFKAVREEGPDGNRAFYTERMNPNSRNLVMRICKLPDFGKRGSYTKWARCMTEILKSGNQYGIPANPNGNKDWIYTAANPKAQQIKREKNDRAKLQEIEAEMKRLPAIDRKDTLAAPYDELVKPSGEEITKKISLQNRYDKYTARIGEHGVVTPQDILKGLRLKIEDRLRHRHHKITKKSRK